MGEEIKEVTAKNVAEWKRPTEQQFSLDKVKLIKAGGLDVNYTVSVSLGDQIYNDKYHIESAKDIHPDLKKLFESLNVIVARTFGLTSFLSCVESPDFKASAKQKQDARDFAKKLLDRIEVKGVTFNGQGDNVSVIITSMLGAPGDERGDKTASAINTPKLRYSTEKYGFEQKLEEIAGDIEREVYEYIFNGKKAQQELFTGDNNAQFPNVPDPIEETDEADNPDENEF